MKSTGKAYSRRSFVAGSMAAGGALSLLKPSTALTYQANSKITVGLIGAGGRGSYDARIVHADSRAEVTALCDLFEDRIEKSAQTIGLSSKPAVFRDFEKLLASGVDAVIIATPPFEHPRMLEAAIQANKHVFCEKPIGVDAEGCRRAMEAARRADPRKCISVGFQQRYGAVYLEAFQRIQGGQLGEITVARASWIANDPFKRVPYPDPREEKLRNWFCYRDYSGDIIVEQDCHNFDVLHWFLGGLPVSAIGRGGTRVRTSMEILDHLSLTFLWSNGIQVNYEANQITPRGFSRVGEEFTGTKSSLAVSRTEMVHYTGGREPERLRSPRDITIDALESFLTRIANNDPENTVERSALSTMIALLGRAAIYKQKEVTWKGEFWS